MRRYLFPVLIGIVGCTILIQLGLWQLDRRDWKEGMLDQIRQGIDAEPVPLPGDIDPSMKYMPVTVEGTTSGAEINVLSHTKEQGAGYQVVSRFITDDGRAILLDRGFVPQDDRHVKRGPVRLRVTGNLHWPQDAGSSTPAPNLDENIWFARDVDAMARQLGTEPVLVVASFVEGDNQGAEPIPVAIEGIPNNHLSYAMQWFMIAATWAVMTLALIWRIRQRSY
ncbi:SURF1 family protein [Paracoccus sp. 1_MG-2023]|uniref:SURF1 family protein n=1 Tax=unclassified Paracoccus (in: a-proteobacteria) TaxID=2688777 RepID=UPI001C09D222|nr:MULTISPECIES: SURF1 family protein [unclassified Paracoccus (in: a-proteobacteria)]MBU2957544.1 SURF1 family protein [Paracoccus sp. C2R09]MDO6669796.1 SURF1 family protein [Paracoccus sp. 1_MG-2023]